MKYFLILLAFLLAPNYANAQTNMRPCFQTMPGVTNSNCVPGIQAANSVAIDIAAATTTQLVALSGNTRIFITSWDVMAGGTLNVSLVYGTGSSCGTGQVALTGSYRLVAQAGISKGNGLGPILFVPSGNALCIVTSGSSAIGGSVSYVQF